jgi:hypothetical protein
MAGGGAFSAGGDREVHNVDAVLFALALAFGVVGSSGLSVW